jgi:hypothetical protein
MKVKNMRDFGYLTQSSAINKKNQKFTTDQSCESSLNPMSAMNTINEESKTD